MVIDSQVPTVVIHNNLEVFDRFLSRAVDLSILYQRRFRGDRALFWLGAAKLVCVTSPIANAKDLCHRWGYDGTQVLVPEGEGSHLCLDLIHDPWALDQIVAYAGAEHRVQLVPYASTPELYLLADTLRQDYHLEVLLPESPAREDLWLRDYIDTKSGFRTLVPGWLDPLGSLVGPLPAGFVCPNAMQAAEVIGWFLRRQKGCVIKADNGESGNGNYVFSPNGEPVFELLARGLAAKPFLRDDLLVVEEYIDNPTGCSPSLEFFVPPLGTGEPVLTYLSNQVFETFGLFSGVLISREYLTEAWYPQLARCGWIIAKKLQSMGYVGHFDLDTVVDGQGNLYLLEVNARRTGGTYVHELAVHLFGEHYLDQVVLLSVNRILCPRITTYADLLHRVEDLLFIPGTSTSGIVITVTSALHEANFGCVFIAPTVGEIQELRNRLYHRVQQEI